MERSFSGLCFINFEETPHQGSGRLFRNSKSAVSGNGNAKKRTEEKNFVSDVLCIITDISKKIKPNLTIHKKIKFKMLKGFALWQNSSHVGFPGNSFKRFFRQTPRKIFCFDFSFFVCPTLGWKFFIRSRAFLTAHMPRGCQTTQTNGGRSVPENLRDFWRKTRTNA